MPMHIDGFEIEKTYIIYDKKGFVRFSHEPAIEEEEKK